MVTSSGSEKQGQNALDFPSRLLSMAFKAIYNLALNLPFNSIFLGPPDDAFIYSFI